MSEIDDKKLKKVEKRLNQAMRDLLYGGGGDPGWTELSGAATCFEILKLLGLKIKEEKDIRQTLEKDNVYDDNFIKKL